MLEIKLTDAGDPFFLWQAVLSEEDYRVLAQEQGLRPSFAEFPYHLMRLFERVVTHFREQSPSYPDIRIALMQVHVGLPRIALSTGPSRRF